MVEPSINSSPIPPNVPSAEIQRNELQKTADYYVFQKAVRTSWRSCIILGVIGVIFGFIFTRIFSPINLIMVPIGLLLIIAGIRSRVTTKLNSLLLSGIALTASGIWIIIIAVINFFAFFNYLKPCTVNFYYIK
jgi:TRAP-type C4-dicarboxylate transport system permease large subunit